VPALIASLNVAVTLAVPLTPTCPSVGDVAVMVGDPVSAVVNDQLDVDASGLPETSLTPLLPPVTVAVYLVLDDRVEPGVNVAVRVATSYVTVAETGAVPVRVNVVALMVLAFIASLNVTVTAVDALTPVAPEAGERAVIVGALVSAVVNDQVAVAARALPARSLTPFAPPRTEAV